MRDFTYIDDIVESITRIMHVTPQPEPHHIHAATSYAPFRIYNIGNHQPIELKYYIEVLEKYLGKKARLQMLPPQAGDLLNTYADVSQFENTVGRLPHTSIENGIERFTRWYKNYYQVTKEGDVESQTV